MNDKIRSQELYLPTIVVVVGDADGGGDGTRSMSKSLMLKSSSKSSMRVEEELDAVDDEYAGT
jgi:non-canonical (house-cleaning) NTP pyrophosphatase